ncbi:hypothetical protein [Novilysobacter avium]|uniref:hypothetical protein n=1 Tax=Novilysobacter avium TaxID=2781023 RepID=UPI00387E5B62
MLLDTHAAITGQVQSTSATASATQPGAPETPAAAALALVPGVEVAVDSTAQMLGPAGSQVAAQSQGDNLAEAGEAEAEAEQEGVAALPPLAPGERMDTARLLKLVEVGKEPLRGFLIKHSSDTERAFFLRSAQRLLPPARQADISANDFIVIVPAFTVSELTAAFQIGFLIFLPFLIIDLVVANILLALGMMMMSPTIVSLPFKLLLFVLIDGWAKLVHGLVLTYAI